MNVLQIEAERGAKGWYDGTLIVRVGDHASVNLELLAPKRSRWHWWRDEHRHTTEHTIMCPVLGITTKWWGADRGNDSVPSTVVVPKVVLAKLRALVTP